MTGDPTFQLFQLPDALSNMASASPRVMSYAEFSRFLEDRPDHVRAFAERFLQYVQTIHSAGLLPCAALIGGSFLRSDAPKDIDAVLFYSMAEGSNSIGDFVALQSAGLEGGLDVKLRPIDGPPIVTIQMICYFHTLFSLDRRSNKSIHGSLLINLGGIC